MNFIGYVYLIRVYTFAPFSEGKRMQEDLLLLKLSHAKFLVNNFKEILENQ